jgi:LPXTG-motif cell wall-anchored protein
MTKNDGGGGDLLEPNHPIKLINYIMLTVAGFVISAGILLLYYRRYRNKKAII